LLDYPSDQELMRAYRNGDLEAITISLDEAWSLAETMSDVRIVTIQDISNGGDAILGKPEIKNLQELKTDVSVWSLLHWERLNLAEL
jgi:NitT/TauT family transport system substrate-binding protein